MITGIPSVDNGLQEVSENLTKSQEIREKFYEDLNVKIKNTNRKEREFLIFKLFFDGLTYNEKTVLMEMFKKNPLMFDRLWWVINIANDARKYSRDASYNRNKCCIEIMNIYKSLLEKMSKLAKELDINNSLELSILFSYLLWNGYLSKTKNHEFKSNIKDVIVGLLFADITNGIGVCRNYSEMLKDFLEFSGYQSIILENNFGNNKVDYVMDIGARKLCSTSGKDIYIKKKPNHVFNLIEDNGLYIYDPTNLLFYNLKNKNMAFLINGKGKNIVYPYHSYDFCYSKEDEKMLDKMFTEDNFTSPYTKTDFISTSEVNLELIRNNHVLIEDFYTDARSDILGISEETNKILRREK